MARIFPIRCVVVVWLVFVTQASQSALAEETACGKRVPGHEIWRVSSRQLGCPDHDADPELCVERLDEHGGWIPAPLDALTGADTGVTIVYVHGNRIDDREATRRAMGLYRLVEDESPDALRLVVWSWPASASSGPLRDFRRKALRADVDAEYLAWLLARMKSRVSLVGYSYGARVVTGAIHALGDGTVIGQAPTDDTSAVPIRAVFLAAGVHNDWLLPGHCHDQAVPRAELIVSLYNSCDPALKRYGMIEKCGRPRALGYVGFDTSALGDHADRVRQINVAGWIGRTHDEYAYYHNSRSRQEIRDAVLFADLQPSP